MIENIHHVSVTTRVEAHGTPDAHAIVAAVEFVCTAAPDAECRDYPECECEGWVWDEAKTHDQNGHERVTGRPCWLEAWFATGGALFIGDDADDMRDDGVPAADRSGYITYSFADEWVEWKWAEIDG